MKWILGSTFGLTGFIFLLVACPLLAVGVGAYYFTGYAIKDWPLVPGMVTGMGESQSYDSDNGSYITTYCPYVQYTTVEGETIEVNLNDCSTPPAFQVGDAVEVYYNPAEPKQAVLKGGTLQLIGNIFAIIFGGIGGLLCLAGGGLTILAMGAVIWPKGTKTPASM